MSIFRNVLRIARRHPFYLAIYVVVMSIGCVGLGMSMGSSAPVTDTAWQPYEANVVVVDRDDSPLSTALVENLGQTYVLVDVADDEFALQDALATGTADCVLIIPADFGDQALAAARDGRDLPKLSCAYGYKPRAGALVSQAASHWVSLAAGAAALMPDATADQLARMADAADAQRATVTLAASEATGEAITPLMGYLNFSMYMITCSIVVCCGLALSAFGRDEVRARNAASPVASLRLSLSQVAGCVVLAGLVWAWTCGVGLVAFSDATASVGTGQLALAFAALGAYALVPLAIAFLLAQLHLREEGINAVGNIAGLVMSFLGGSWVPLALTSQTVQAAARLTPTFWATDAITRVLEAPGLTDGLAAQVAGNVGIVVLFAVALVAVGLAVGRARAGGRRA